MESNQVYLITNIKFYKTVANARSLRKYFNPISRRELKYGRGGTVRSFGERVGGGASHRGYLQDEEGSWCAFETSTKLYSSLLLRSQEVLEEFDRKKRNTRKMQFQLMTQLSTEQVGLSLGAGGFHFSFLVGEVATRS